MEYDKRKTRPESTRKFLIQQVQDQSSLCDVVVKMGYWEKRFHRSVLVASPFFDHVLNDNFLEKQTGKIEISIGTPVTLETAIMFLYGQKPKFDQEIIENTLHMAEFLLIPNLKSACIAWMKSDIITEENCLKYLQLSSIYDFELPRCTIYIKRHLPEMLPQLLNLTKDSIQLLFSDKRLSYVPMDDKLSFLLKWSDANPDARKVHMQELLTSIDFRELSQQILEDCKQNPNINDAIRLVESPSLVHGTSQRVLIMKAENRDGTFWCLDLERDQWFRVDSETFKEERSYNYKEISGTFKRDSESLICFFDKGFQRCSILALNLTLDTCSKMNVICDESYKLKRIDDLKIDTDKCVISVNEEIKSDKKLDEHSEAKEIRRRFNLMSLNGCSPLDQTVAMRLIQNRSLSSVYIKTSTLYVGHIDSGNVADVEMTPLLSFKHDEILQCCIGQNAIAIIFKSRKHMAIYDLQESNLEKIEQSTEYKDKLARFKDGFVIYNNKRCISFIRMIGPCLEKKYEVKELSFEHDNYHNTKYILCGQMLYRYYQKSYKENFIFESIPYQTMLSMKTEDPVVWKQLPLPKEANSCYKDTIKYSCFEIHLPKFKLRCHIECPHCEKTSRPVTSRVTYDSDDYIYGDSSDDDYYEPSYYDGDYGFYYDSD